jgi:hypothetical protein
MALARRTRRTVPPRPARPPPRRLTLTSPTGDHQWKSRADRQIAPAQPPLPTTGDQLPTREITGGASRLSEQVISVKGKLIDAWYYGKAHEHGGNIQALSALDGFPLWVSAVEPGSTHNLTAARVHVLAALYWASSQLDLSTLADGGYEGAGIGVFTPVKQPTDGHELDVNTRTYNALLRGLRCLGERGFAVLVGRWRALRHITTSPRKIGDIVKAELVLTHFEHGRLT